MIKFIFTSTLYAKYECENVVKEWAGSGCLESRYAKEYLYSRVQFWRRRLAQTKKNEVNQEIVGIILPNMTQTHVVDLEKNEHLFFIP